MINHDLLDLFAMLAAGVVGSLVSTPLRNVVFAVAKRPHDRSPLTRSGAPPR